MPDEKPFIVRGWPIDVAKTELSPERFGSFSGASQRAWELAQMAHVRSAAVTDDHGMTWCQFNMVWSIPEEFR
jgi:hypothetical protein